MNDFYKRLIRQLQSTVPTCLQNFKAIGPKVDPEVWHQSVAWKVGCPCGSVTGAILGYPLRKYVTDYSGPETYLSPLAFRCAKCRKATELFDTNEHGYDAECGKLAGSEFRSSNIRGEGEREDFPCPDCEKTEFHVTTYFTHPHFDLIEDEPELEPRAQDFFDVFNCNGKCASCGTESNIACFELD
jgi:hypothetical protein